MDQKRILTLATHKESGNAVVYVMSRDQRVADNHALLAAQAKAIELKVGLVVVFNLIAPAGVRAYEHAQFMLDGLKEVSKTLKTLNIPFIMTVDKKGETLEDALTKLKPSALYFDFSPLKGRRDLAKQLAKKIGASTYVVDTHNIIPAWVASDHQEYAAHTFRNKVHKHLETYLHTPDKIVKHPHTAKDLPKSLSFTDAQKHIHAYPKRSIKLQYEPGEKAAAKQLNTFIQQRLKTYAHKRNDIAEDNQSGLSPYLHFGHISSLRVALEVINHVGTAPLLYRQARMASAGDTPSTKDGMNALLEEMIVRKELSDNFCLYAKNYRSLDSLPDWSKSTLAKHKDDPREFTYTRDQLEQSKTHDDIWNAAQKELVTTGKLHGYMRMYWAKKILEWSKTPQGAVDAAIYLNDAYSIDGGDSNGYVGILWSIGGLHDRPWTERSVFGTVRYMNAAGLRRKYDVDTYIEQINKLT